jgi:uncharacterized protein (DUF302 family)
MVRVMLTEQGNAKVESWQQRRRELLAHLLAPLDEDEQATLQHLIERVLETAEGQSRTALQEKEQQQEQEYAEASNS